MARGGLHAWWMGCRIPWGLTWRESSAASSASPGGRSNWPESGLPNHPPPFAEETLRSTVAPVGRDLAGCIEAGVEARMDCGGKAMRRHRNRALGRIK